MNINLEQFKFTASYCRRLAENMWGKGGTHAYRTNKRGFYYYSCSGHGGYVVPKESLSKRTLEILNRAGFTPEPIYLGVQHGSNSTQVLGILWPNYQRLPSIRYYPHLGRFEWMEYEEVYTFEEDCNWAIIEYLEGVNTEHTSKITDEVRLKTIERWSENVYREILRIQAIESEPQLTIL